MLMSNTSEWAEPGSYFCKASSAQCVDHISSQSDFWCELCGPLVWPRGAREPAGHVRMHSLQDLRTFTIPDVCAMFYKSEHDECLNNLPGQAATLRDLWRHLSRPI